MLEFIAATTGLTLLAVFVIMLIVMGIQINVDAIERDVKTVRDNSIENKYDLERINRNTENTEKSKYELHEMARSIESMESDISKIRENTYR